jgi:hypothetical protein
MNWESLEKTKWQELAQQHASDVRAWTVPHRERRRVGESHPIHDFLFVYYRYSSMKLEKWHPGVNVHLQGTTLNDGGFSTKFYREIDSGLVCDPSFLRPKEVDRLDWIFELLRRTESNRPNYSCLGLHEWAMVYRGKEVRHEQTTQLRLPQSEVDQLVESRPLTCTHFDAFRFFAEEAKPLNRTLPTLNERPEYEQPACIHANMDLYKWAFKSMPWIGSDLLKRCFDLAMAARSVDMRASPYDLSKYDGYEPIRIETAEGRAEYEREQRQIAKAAVPLREELAAKIEHVVNLNRQSCSAQ